MTEPGTRRLFSRLHGALRPALAALAIAALGAIAPAAASAAQEAHAPTSAQAPHISGAPAVGQTLSCSTGQWTYSPTSFTYAWLRDGRPIPGQSASTYVVQSADGGHSISCAVTASSSGGEYSLAALRSGAYEIRFSGPEGAGNHLPQVYAGKSLTEGFDAVALAVPGSVSGIDAALSPGAQISGRVTASVGGAPISGASVCADDESIYYTACAQSDAGGEYVISGLFAGSYEVSAQPPQGSDYLSASHGGLVAAALGHDSGGVSLALPAAGQITGRVTSAKTGQPLAGIEVCAIPTRSGAGPCVHTDATGEYAMHGLAENGYDIEFSAAGEESFLGGWTYAPQDYVPQYYDAKQPGSPPDEVTVTLAKQSYEGIDARLQVGATISGKVADGAGAGVPKVEACVHGAGGKGYCDYTGASGEYEIQGLPQGEYEVAFEREGERTTSSRISLPAEGSATGVDGEMRLLGAIAGVVRASGSDAPLPGLQVCAEATANGRRECALTDSHGEYAIVNLAEGEYRVEFNAGAESPDGYAVQFWNGAESFEAARAAHVALGRTTTGIDAALTAGGSITGRVTDAISGAGVAGAQVCAETTSGRYFYECVTTAAGGTSTPADSNSLAVPAPPPAPGGSAPDSAFQIIHRSIDRRTGAIHLSVETADKGTFAWKLSFQCAAARRAVACSAKSARFARGARSLDPGVTDIAIHPDAKARATLRRGRAIKISGALSFQSSLGGSPSSSSFKLTLTPREHGARHGGSGDRRSKGHRRPKAKGHRRPKAKGHRRPKGKGHHRTKAKGHHRTKAKGHHHPKAKGHHHPKGKGRHRRPRTRRRR